MTLGDTKANASNKGIKTRQERSVSAVFNTMVELQERGQWRLHTNVEASVDALLAGRQPDIRVGVSNVGSKYLGITLQCCDVGARPSGLGTVYIG